MASPTPNNHIDKLTGLHNQRWLDETLDRLILRAATDRAPLSLVVVDLLDVPGLTTEYEQEMLDMALCEIAKTLTLSLRPTDLIARHATGRFVIILPNTNPADAMMISTRIQENVNSTNIVIPGVCVLPPMKVVMGEVTLSAFVSGRKLMSDAFATLEKNRVTHLAAMNEPPMGTPVEHELIIADVSVLPSEEVQAQTEEATDSMGPFQTLAEPLPAPVDDLTTAVTLATVSEVRFEVNTTSDSAPENEVQDNVSYSDAALPQEHPKDPPHLAA